MSRSLSALHRELKNKGQVRIPEVSRQEIIDTFTLGPVIGVAGVLVIVLFEYHWGRSLVGFTMAAAGIIASLWALHGWRRRLMVTTSALQFHREPEVPFADIESISLPSGSSLLNIHLSAEGLLRHYPDASETDADQLGDAGNRIIVWDLGADLSDDEVRFLREQVEQSG